MKLNFLKVLNTNKSSTDEIAAEIAALEQKQKECEQEYASLMDQAKSLRSNRLCGEAVSEADIRDADRKADSTRLDIEAVSETISKLRAKLHDVFQAIKDNHVAESQRRWDSIAGDRRKAVEEVARAKAHLLVAGEAYVGSFADQITRNGQIFNHDKETHELFLSESDRLRAQLKKPTYFEKKQEMESSSRWALEMNVDEEVETAIEKYRVTAVSIGSADN